MSVIARAPGKLYLAGEYAVTVPGEPAVLAAVDRYVTVEVSAAAGGVIVSDRAGVDAVRWRRAAGRVVAHPDDGGSHALAAVRVVEALAAEHGLAGRDYAVRIASELDAPDGRKLGLGSSAAVTVAVVAAVARWYALTLTDRELFLLALVAAAQVDGDLSGGDLAACAHRGWIRYRSPDRHALLARYRRAGAGAVLAGPCPGLEIARLPEPRAARLVVGWTGTPASTRSLVGRARGVDAVGPWRTEFLARSRAAVGDFAAAIERDDVFGMMAGVRAARTLLRAFGRRAGISIETAALTALCESAARDGAAGKSSGAGGGDCGIVVAPAAARLDGMMREWGRHDIRDLDLHTAPPEPDRGAHA